MSATPRRRRSTPALAAALCASAAGAAAAPARPTPALGAHAAHAEASPEAARLRAAGFRALDAGRTGKAETHFRAALALTPNDAGALGGLGVLEFRAGRLEAAETLLARAVAHGGEAEWAKPLAEVRFYRDLRAAQQARDAGDLPRAREIAARLETSALDSQSLARTLRADIDARLAVRREEHALAAWKAGDLPAADAAFQEAIAATPGDPWRRYRYARFLSWRGDKPAAEALMAPLAEARDPQSLFAAALHDNGERRGAAAADLMNRIPPAGRTPAMEKFEQSLQAQFAVEAARSLKKAGRSELAQAGLRRLGDRPELPTGAMAQIADGLFAVDDAAAAQRLAARAQARPLGSPYEYEGVVSVLGRSGEKDAAEALIARLAPQATEPLVQADVERLRARLVLATADWLSRKGDTPAAIDLLQAQRRRTPRDPELLSALGWTALDGGEDRLALEAFADLSAERPDDVNALLGLAAAAARARKYAEAETVLARAGRLAPADPEVRLAAARLDQAQGQWREALADLRQAAALRQQLAAADPFAALSPAVQSRVRPAFEGLQDAAAGRTAPDSRLSQEIETVTDAASTRLEFGLDRRAHTGDPGLSRLAVERARLAASTLAGRGRVQLELHLVETDSGHLRGAVAAASTRSKATGVEALAAYAAGGFRAELGATPIGFGGATVQGEVAWNGQLASDLQARAWAERRPMTDSLVSYAGGRTAAGLGWGRVTRTAAGGGLTLTRNQAGVYASASAAAYSGRHVRDNTSFKADLGAYGAVFDKPGARLTAGLNLGYQTYDRNENAFLYGFGGYFSPQRFVSLAAPLRLTARRSRWSVDAQASPGYQSYRQDAAGPGFAPESKKGFGGSASLAVERELRPGLVIGGEVGVNTFGAYRESRAGLHLKTRFGAER